MFNIALISTITFLMFMQINVNQSLEDLSLVKSIKERYIKAVWIKEEMLKTYEVDTSSSELVNASIPLSWNSFFEDELFNENMNIEINKNLDSRRNLFLQNSVKNILNKDLIDKKSHTTFKLEVDTYFDTYELRQKVYDKHLSITIEHLLIWKESFSYDGKTLDDTVFTAKVKDLSPASILKKDSMTEAEYKNLIIDYLKENKNGFAQEDLYETIEGFRS